MDSVSVGLKPKEGGEICVALLLVGAKTDAVGVLPAWEARALAALLLTAAENAEAENEALARNEKTGGD